MMRSSGEMHDYASEQGIELSGHFQDALVAFAQAEVHFSELAAELSQQGGPNAVNLPLQHKLEKAAEAVEGCRDHATFHLGRSAARMAHSVRYIGNLPSVALLHVSF